MRGQFQDQSGLFSYIDLEERIPQKHPLRKVRALVREVLSELDHDFAQAYSHEGRPSIPPEMLLSALLLQVFYGIRSEIQLMEQLNYNLLFRWFVGLSPDDPVWVPETFCKNRERLQSGEIFQKFMAALLDHKKVKPLLSDEHFSVDGTLIEAWASHKSFRPKDGSDNDDGENFHGQKRKNDTHASTTDPDSRLYRKAAGREWYRRYRDNGETTARKKGQPPGSKLDKHEAFILGLVEETPDVSLAEISEQLLAEHAVSAVPSTVWEFFNKRGITFKKRQHMQASSNARM